MNTETKRNATPEVSEETKLALELAAFLAGICIASWFLTGHPLTFATLLKGWHVGMLSKIPVSTRIGITAVALVVYTVGFLATEKYFGSWWIVWLPFGMFILAILFPWIDRGGGKHEVSPGDFPGS